MAAMTTALTEFFDLGDSRTYTQSGHLATKPKLVIQKRRVPVGSQVVNEVSFQVLNATNDATGALMSQKVGFKATVTYPLGAESAVITAALATFRDIVAGDEFGSTVTTLNWLKP